MFHHDRHCRGPLTGTGLANLIKPMLDGLVSCLHAHDGSNPGRACHSCLRLRGVLPWRSVTPAPWILSARPGSWFGLTLSDAGRGWGT
jgi:hypothetical protein